MALEQVGPVVRVLPYLNLANYARTEANLQAQINEAKGGGQRLLQLDKAAYQIGTGLVFDGGTDLVIEGQGPNATQLVMAADGITLISLLNVFARVTLKNLWLGSFASRPTGYGIKAIGTSGTHADNLHLDNVVLQNLPVPFYAEKVDQSTARNVRAIQSIAGAVKGVAFHWIDCRSWHEVVNVWTSATVGTFPSDGIRLDSDCDSIFVSNGIAQHCDDYGVHLLNSLGGGSTGPRLCRFNNYQSEINVVGGFLTEDGRDNRFVSCHAAANGGAGFETSGGQSATYTDCLALENGHHGFHVTGGTAGAITSCSASNNSQAADNTYDGIRVEDGVTGVRVNSNISGDFMFAGGNNQRYGLSIGSVGTDSIVAQGNDLTGNQTGGLGNFSPGSNNSISGNVS
jgi:hypothetical protein